MTKEEMQSMAFMMIAHAGSAFDCFYRAVDLAEEARFEEARTTMQTGKEELNAAHRSQADLLSAEVRAEDIPFGIIMSHAQDHLTMGIFMERMAEKLIRVYQKLEAGKE